MRSRTVVSQKTRIEDDLIAPYIVENPCKPGRANARLIDYGIAVWASIGALEAAHNNIAEVAADYELPPDAIKAAIAFYQRYKEITDDRRLGNSRVADLA
jgi:uncharacterized protein (DUF433 family)